MPGTVRFVMKLLLLSLIRTGVNGEDSLILTYPCGKDFCYNVWHLSAIANSEIAIVCNGEIQTSAAQLDDSKCTYQIEDLTKEDVRHHRCQPSPVSKAAATFILTPGKTLTLQCVLFTYFEQDHCYTPMQQEITLMWVDETGAQIHADSQHQIQQRSPCEVTLTLALQSPGRKKFRCQATVGEQSQSSAAVWVRVPGLTGSGRGFFVNPEKEHQGGNSDIIGGAVGVVGCVVLTALIAAFAVNRRRAGRQLPHEPCNTIDTNHVMYADDVIYADIILPVSSEAVQVQECETTEYACIRYK
ncbi:uncharacterized protein PAE49_002421 [Odontesthes bonariensis]|uniref:uncharacterized protein LOC142375385 n=1 Tax=Odontesthes bonariensis TaxID=219752 RepID=UPI003F58FD20